MWGTSGLGSSQSLVEAAFEKMRTQGGGKDSVPLQLLLDSFKAKALPKVRGHTAAEGGEGGRREKGEGRGGGWISVASTCVCMHV
jgi:hypothetical protein